MGSNHRFQYISQRMIIEDVPMDISALSTPTQMILAGSLLGVLLVWLVIFATLAFRRHATKQQDFDDRPTPSGSFPAITVQVIHSPTTLTSVGIIHAASAHTAVVNTEMRGDMGTLST